jgi:hypothetical protein
MDKTDLGSCLIAAFSTSDAKPMGSISRQYV